jgi:molybdate-binding protein
MPQIFGFASWRQGLVLDRRLSNSVAGIADVVRLGLRLVNREPGAEARTLLDRLCEQAAVDGSALDGYGAEVHGHLEVAASVAAGLADVGVASEPAALAYGLGFLPLSVERFDLALTPRLSSSPETQALTRVLRSPWLRGQLASIAGYDASPCGEEVAPS